MNKDKLIISPEALAKANERIAKYESNPESQKIAKLAYEYSLPKNLTIEKIFKNEKLKLVDQVAEFNRRLLTANSKDFLGLFKLWVETTDAKKIGQRDWRSNAFEDMYVNELMKFTLEEILDRFIEFLNEGDYLTASGYKAKEKSPLPDHIWIEYHRLYLKYCSAWQNILQKSETMLNN